MSLTPAEGERIAQLAGELTLESWRLGRLEITGPPEAWARQDVARNAARAALLVYLAEITAEPTPEPAVDPPTPEFTLDPLKRLCGACHVPIGTGDCRHVGELADRIFMSRTEWRRLTDELQALRTAHPY